VPAALRRPRVGTVFGKFILPLAAAKEIAAADGSRLDGLDESAVLLSDAKAHAATLQRQIGSIVIGADQPAARADRWGRHLNERSLQLGQIGCRGGKLEFDFRRDATPPSLRSSGLSGKPRSFVTRSVSASFRVPCVHLGAK